MNINEDDEVIGKILNTEYIGATLNKCSLSVIWQCPVVNDIQVWPVVMFGQLLYKSFSHALMFDCEISMFYWFPFII